MQHDSHVKRFSQIRRMARRALIKVNKALRLMDEAEYIFDHTDLVVETEVLEDIWDQLVDFTEVVADRFDFHLSLYA